MKTSRMKSSPSLSSNSKSISISNPPLSSWYYDERDHYDQENSNEISNSDSDLEKSPDRDSNSLYQFITRMHSFSGESKQTELSGVNQSPLRSIETARSID